jgi:nucleoside 2-deoxyribosyltransferase
VFIVIQNILFFENKKVKNKKKMVKVYLASKWGDRAIISDYIKELQSNGIDISFDWTCNEIHECKNHEEMAFYAEKDIQGVLDADIVVALILDPTYAYRGTFTEIGCAIGSNKKVCIVCPLDNADIHSNVFYWHKSIQHFTSWEAFLLFLNIQKQ